MMESRTPFLKPRLSPRKSEIEVETIGNLNLVTYVFVNQVYYSVVTIFGRMNLAHLEHFRLEIVRTLG